MSRRSVLMEALAATPRDLERTLRRVDEERAQEIAPNGWSMMGLVAHLCETEAEYVQRWQRAVEHDGDLELPVPSETLAVLILGFTNQRERTLDFLGSLEQHQWGVMLDREGTSRRLREDVQALVGHDNEHLNQLLELRKMVEIRK